jgi:hypothetical protein
MPNSLRVRVLAIISLLLALAPALAFGGRTDWRQMTVGHFYLFSTLRDSPTREVARQLNAFEKTVGEMLQSQVRLPDVPTLIYILDHGDFLRYAAGRSAAAGIFFERPFANLITIDGDYPFDLVRVAVFHEYTHFLLRSSTTLKLPPWYNEGYAMLFSSFKLDKQQVSVGTEPAGAGIDMQQWIPMERVLAVKQSDPEYRAERLAQEFYGESWALVHLLLFDNRTLAAPTARYLIDLDDGIPEPEAFKDFPFDKQALDQAVRSLIQHRVIHVKLFKYEKQIAVDEAPSTRMTAPQTDAALLRLLFLLGDREDLIAPIASTALKENPGDPAILALTARIAARHKHPFNVEDLAASLSKGGADNSQLRIDVADALLAGSESGATADSTSAARKALAILDELALGENPPVEAALLWASAAHRAGMDQEKVVPVLERVSARVPHNTLVLQGLAFASEALGDKGQARAYYNRIVLMSESPEERLWAQKQADSSRLH